MLKRVSSVGDLGLQQAIFDGQFNPNHTKNEGGKGSDDEKCGNSRKRRHVDSVMSIIHWLNASTAQIIFLQPWLF